MFPEVSIHAHKQSLGFVKNFINLLMCHIYGAHISNKIVPSGFKWKKNFNIIEKLKNIYKKKKRKKKIYFKKLYILTFKFN